MEGGLASALFTTRRRQEELLPLILATAFLLSGVELLWNNSEYLEVMSADVAVIYSKENVAQTSKTMHKFLSKKICTHTHTQAGTRIPDGEVRHKSGHHLMLEKQRCNISKYSSVWDERRIKIVYACVCAMIYLRKS